MAKIVTFRGMRHLKPGHGIATPPVTGVWHPGDCRVFDRALAMEYGRSCGPACDGDCWAQFFVATQNISAPEKYPAFEVTNLPSPAKPTTTATRGKEQK